MLVTIDGHIKLTDFGLTITYHDTLRFSTTDTFGGTMRWMVHMVLVASYISDY